MDDEILTGKPRDPFVEKVEPLEDWKLRLTFENGEERLFDMKPYRFGVFAELEDPNYFKRVRVSRGSIAWPHGQALAYDMLHYKSEALAAANNE
jgi:hypothetical protein